MSDYRETMRDVDDEGEDMTAQPVTTDRWYQPKPPFTVDTLFELPESDLRYEVLGGQIIVSPTPTPAHNRAADRLGRLIDPLLPSQIEIITAMAVRMPDGDGPVPDLLITSGDVDKHKKGMPADTVHSVIEVVSPSSKAMDRIRKAAVYAAGGIPCCWRVELQGWKDHFGPVPAVVVRLFADGEFSEQLFAAGQVHDIPLAIGPGPDPEVIAVALDPAALVGPKR